MTYAKGDRVRVDSTRHGPSHYNGQVGTVVGILSAFHLAELKRGRAEIADATQGMLVALDKAPTQKKLRPVDLFGLPCVDSDIKPEDSE